MGVTHNSVENGMNGASIFFLAYINSRRTKSFLFLFRLLLARLGGVLPGLSKQKPTRLARVSSIPISADRGVPTFPFLPAGAGFSAIFPRPNKFKFEGVLFL
jgi:hypothetical protein